MILQIKNLHNDTFPIECEEAETVKDVKNKIAATDGLREKYTYEILKLLYKGKVMEDDQTIASFEIPADGYLLLVKQTPGKPPVPKKKKNQILFNLLEGLQTLSAMAQMSDPFMKNPLQSPLHQPFNLNSPMNQPFNLNFPMHQSIQPNADWSQSPNIKPAMHQPFGGSSAMSGAFGGSSAISGAFSGGPAMSGPFGGSSAMSGAFGGGPAMPAGFSGGPAMSGPFGGSSFPSKPDFPSSGFPSGSSAMPGAFGGSSFPSKPDFSPTGFPSGSSSGFSPPKDLKNEEHVQALNNLVEMGFDKVKAEKALRAANYNLDGATELLTSGAIDALKESDIPPAGGYSGYSGRHGSGMDSKQLTEVLRKNPAQLQLLKESLRRENPQIAQMIERNPEDFFKMLDQMPAGGGGASAVNVSLAPHEERIIDELVEMGFSKNLAKEAYLACDRNKDLAVNYLLQSAE